jgi:hypothetical protein
MKRPRPGRRGTRVAAGKNRRFPRRQHPDPSESRLREPSRGPSPRCPIEPEAAPKGDAAGLARRRGANLLLVEEFVERVVRRLRQEPGFSRNRHFLTLSSPEGRRALKIHRQLRSIERDLSRASSATIDRAADRVRLTLRSKSGLRTSWLTHAEFRILCANPIVRSALNVSA